MSEQDASESQRGYLPFPAFAQWAELPFDLPTFNRYADLLRQARTDAGEEALRAAVRIATRYAAVDTGAIEGLYEVDRGFTRTIALEAASWEAALQAKGLEASRAIEDAIRGYEYVLDAATESVPITEAWIRQLHEVLCASQESYTVYTTVGPQQQALPKGQYKTMPNSPTNMSTGRVHHYAPVEDTSAEMNRLVGELQSDAFAAAHPVLQAAYAHYGFVCVHPFADGNGRVSRALASVFLYRRPGVPLVIFADEKARYLDALEAADSGHPLDFCNFVVQKSVDAIEIVRLQMRPRTAPSIAESLDSLQSALIGRKGLPHPEMDAAAQRVLGIILAELQSQIGALSLPPGVTLSADMNGGQSGISVPDGFRNVVGAGQFVAVAGMSPPPASGQKRMQIAAFPALPNHEGPDFRVVCSVDVAHSLDALVSEVVPMVAEVLKLRVASWAEAHLEVLVAALVQQAQEALRSSGYI